MSRNLLQPSHTPGQRGVTDARRQPEEMPPVPRSRARCQASSISISMAVRLSSPSSARRRMRGTSHERHDRRLRDRLSAADGQRPIHIGTVAPWLGHKCRSRHAQQSLLDGRVERGDAGLLAQRRDISPYLRDQCFCTLGLRGRTSDREGQENAGSDTPSTAPREGCALCRFLCGLAHSFQLPLMPPAATLAFAARAARQARQASLWRKPCVRAETSLSPPPRRDAPRAL